jgi:hypothetical protein
MRPFRGGAVSLRKGSLLGMTIKLTHYFGLGTIPSVQLFW